MNEAHNLAAKHSQEMKARNTKRRNKVICITLDVGDRVLINNLNEKGGSGKLRSFWEQEIYRVVGV